MSGPQETRTFLSLTQVLQFLIFVCISMEVGMDVILLVQAKANRVHGATTCCFEVTQSSTPVVPASEPWDTDVESHGSPKGLVCLCGCFYLLHVMGWRERTTLKAIYPVMQYCTGQFSLIFLFLFLGHFSSGGSWTSTLMEASKLQWGRTVSVREFDSPVFFALKRSVFGFIIPFIDFILAVHLILI